MLECLTRCQSRHIAGFRTTMPACNVVTKMDRNYCLDQCPDYKAAKRLIYDNKEYAKITNQAKGWHGWLAKKNYQYNITIALYMLDWWERLFFNVFICLIITYTSVFIFHSVWVCSVVVFGFGMEEEHSKQRAELDGNRLGALFNQNSGSVQASSQEPWCRLLLRASRIFRIVSWQQWFN